MTPFAEIDDKLLKDLAKECRVTEDNLRKIRRGDSYPSRKLAIRLIDAARDRGIEFTFIELMLTKRGGEAR